MYVLCLQFDRSWYKDGDLPNLVGGAAFTRSADVISTHNICSSLASLSQCLHSLEQLLTIAGYVIPEDFSKHMSAKYLYILFGNIFKSLVCLQTIRSPFVKTLGLW